MENEEKGPSTELIMCRSGQGGSAIGSGVAGPSATAQNGQQGGQNNGAAGTKQPPKISTELDVGLALDLIDVVNSNPKDPGAPTALNFVCVIFDKLFQYGQATKCYERLYNDYPDSEWGGGARGGAGRGRGRGGGGGRAGQG